MCTNETTYFAALAKYLQIRRTTDHLRDDDLCVHCRVCSASRDQRISTARTFVLVTDGEMGGVSRAFDFPIATVRANPTVKIFQTLTLSVQHLFKKLLTKLNCPVAVSTHSHSYAAGTLNGKLLVIINGSKKSSVLYFVQNQIHIAQKVTKGPPEYTQICARWSHKSDSNLYGPFRAKRAAPQDCRRKQ